MSLLGYVSAVMQLLLSGAYSSAQPPSESSAQSSTAQHRPRQPSHTHGTLSLGNSQMGRIVEAMLSARAHPTHHRTEARAETPTGTAGSPSQAGSGGAAPSATGLTNALSHVSNANAQAVLAALLGEGEASGTVTADTLLAELSAVDLTEAEARALAEGRVLASRNEDILQRIAAVANPAQPQNTVGGGAEPPQDFAQALAGALMAQFNAAHPALGAYSTLSLAAVASGNTASPLPQTRPAIFV